MAEAQQSRESDASAHLQATRRVCVPRRAEDALERRYRQAAAGHERPGLLIRNSVEAARHTRFLDEQNRQILDTIRDWGRDGLAGIAPRDARSIRRMRKMLDQPSPTESGLPAFVALSLSASSNDKLSATTRSWLGRGYLGPLIHGRFTAAPPFLSTESPDYFRRAGELSSLPGLNGVCHWGTNHLSISSEVRLEADRYLILVHEQLHYASWLGGGDVIRWRGQGDRPVIAGDVRWLHEGLTELHAQQLVRQQGQAPSFFAYPAESAFGFYLQKMAEMGTGDGARGRAVLREAYLTGDFTAVRAIVDGRLGEGTFDVLLGMRDLPRRSAFYPRIRNGAMALLYLEKKLDDAHIDHSGWRSGSRETKELMRYLYGSR